MNPNQRGRIGSYFALLVLLLVFILAVYIPWGPRKNYLRSAENVKDLRNELILAQGSLQEEQVRLKEQEQLMQILDKRDKSFDLFSFVNNLLKETNLISRARLENYRTSRTSPKQPMVQLQIDGVNLQELIDFLHKVYASGNAVVVYEMERLQAAKNNNGLECYMKLMTVKL